MLGRQKVHVPPYTRLAVIYDFVMNHVDYEGWASFLQRIDKRYECGIECIADISCGTGSLCYELEQLGYLAVGCDYGHAMVRQGMLKKNPASRVHLCVADMVNPPFGKSPDMVVSLYDSMNYLMEWPQWRACLDNVYSMLNDGGIFVFDISTLDNSRYMFKRYRFKESNQTASYLRTSRFDVKNAVQENDFEIRFKSDRNTVYCEQHRQKIRPLDEVLHLVHQTPFELLGCFHNFSFRPGTDASERVHIVLRK